jgi:hypothetical protein
MASTSSGAMSALMPTNTGGDDTGLPYNEGMRKRIGLPLLAVVAIGVVAVVAISSRPTAPFAFIEQGDWRLGSDSLIRVKPGERAYTFKGYWPQVTTEAERELKALGYEPGGLMINSFFPVFSKDSGRALIGDHDIIIYPAGRDITYLDGRKPIFMTVVVSDRVPPRNAWSHLFAFLTGQPR